MPKKIKNGIRRIPAFGATAIVAGIIVTTAATPFAQETSEPKPMVETKVLYLSKEYEEPQPLSLVDKILTDNGVQGARFAINENSNTGRFLGYSYKLSEKKVPTDRRVEEIVQPFLENGDRIIVADLEPPDLLALADLKSAKDAIIFNIRSGDNGLRQENCRSNVFHIPPSYAAKADALGQYLAWKRWRLWALVKGKKPSDEQYAQSIKRAAKRFGAKVVEERVYQFEAGARRTESGHQQIQTQMPAATRGMKSHQVLVVADTAEQFGEYMPYRNSDPVPVVGTHGLIAASWHRAFEQWGSKSMQRKFEKFAGRAMSERDYSAWAAVRSIGEAVTRGGGNFEKEIREYLLSDKFALGGFKGIALNFRNWNNQMRQPILITTAKSLVSLSPQEGFLHPKALADTLGFDEPETKCKF